MRRAEAMAAIVGRAAQQHGAFTRRQASAAGLSSRQLRQLADDPTIVEPIRGVLVFSASPATWQQRLMIATLVSTGFYAGYGAAAHLHRIDGFRAVPPIEIVGRRGSRAVRGLDVVQHWVDALDPADLVTITGIPSTGLARTVIDVCGRSSDDLALRAVDDFERRGASLNWLRMTAERLHRPGQSGTGTVMRLLDRRQQGGRVSDSWFERLVEGCISAPGLPPWERQHVIRDDEDRFVARVDLACPEVRLAVEAHSRAFHFGQAPEAADQRRENRMSAEGWHTVYLGWYDTESPTAVAAMIEAIARKRAEQFGVDLSAA